MNKIYLSKIKIPIKYKLVVGGGVSNAIVATEMAASIAGAIATILPTP